LLASQEGQKAKGSALDMQLKETQVLEKNPELIAGKIEEALKLGTPQGEAEAMRLANLKTRVDETRGLDVQKTKAEIARINAQTREAQERIESGKFDWKIINNAAGAPIGVQTINKKTGAIEFKEVDPEVAKKFLDFGGAKPADGKGTDNKSKPTQAEADERILKMRGDTTTPATSTAASPASPAAATPRDMSAPNMAAYNQNTGVYRLNEDPIIKMISDYAGQNRVLLETDPEFARSITAAYANRREELTRTMGTGIRFQ
jgi:hypothetical protein